MTIPDPYERTTLHGRPLDHATAAAVRATESDLGYELTIVQGIGGATASAGTHVKGRAIDTPAYDVARKLAALEANGFVAWYRPTLPGVWTEHIHAVLMFETTTNSRGIAPAALRQIAARLAGRDGLKGNRLDPRGRMNNPRPFTMKDYRAMHETPKPRPKRTRFSRALDRLVEARHSVGQAIALIDDVGTSTPKRRAATAELDDLRRVRRELAQAIETLKGKQ